jgi:hypothetical protein
VFLAVMVKVMIVPDVGIDGGIREGGGGAEKQREEKVFHDLLYTNGLVKKFALFFGAPIQIASKVGR